MNKRKNCIGYNVTLLDKIFKLTASNIAFDIATSDNCNYSPIKQNWTKLLNCLHHVQILKKMNTLLC